MESGQKHKDTIVRILKIIRNVILILLALAVIYFALVLHWLSTVPIRNVNHIVTIEVEADETADYTVFINPDDRGKYCCLWQLDDGVRCRLADYMKANDLVFKPGRQAFLATGDVTLETLLLRYFTFDTKQISEVK